MLKIIGLPKEALLGLHPDSFQRPGGKQFLTKDDIVYIAEALGAFWKYDYEAARCGKVGLHAELKSLLHSDGFLISRILLQYQNIRTIMADQLVMRFKRLGISRPDWVAGIPDGAAEIAKEVAGSLGAKYALMRKENGRLILESVVPAGETLLLIEDFCTRGIGFTEAVLEILSKQPQVTILPYELVILNRGGLKKIVIQGSGSYKLIVEIVAVADFRINDWDPAECPLCKMGSKPIKPKATDENWALITTSQL